MTSRRTLLSAAVGTSILLGAAACTPVPDGGAGPPAPDATQTPAQDVTDLPALADSFFDTWVEDGRVIRHDQGGDTVSEGQAYGMLIATAAGDEERFGEVWDWTTENLQRDDQLISWQWADGTVVDTEPASDAELDMARALVLAGDQFGNDEWTADGIALGGALLDRMTVQTDAGRILAPGLWATAAAPYGYNPSYASPAAYALLAEASGDPRWDELAAGSATVTQTVLTGSPLPPDWAQVQQDGRVEPMPGAQGSGDSVRYSYDAARLPVRYAESCTPDDVALAAQLESALPSSERLPMALDLGGAELNPDANPLGYIARAAVSASTGDTDQARIDLEAAASQAADVPTYYGDAWVVLGVAMLTTDTLGGCPPVTV